MGVLLLACRILASVAAFVLMILCANTLRPSSETASYPSCTSNDSDFLALTPTRLNRFLQGLRFRTISYDANTLEFEELIKLQKFLITSYPLVFGVQKAKDSASIRHWIIGNYSILIKVDGSDKSLLPALIMSHLDVVPTEDQNWTKDPFGATVDEDGYIYARGAIDDKHGVFGILEALEFLLSNKWKPQRTFYISFGHDEEVLGENGNGNVAKHLIEVEKVDTLEFVSDEGFMVADGIMPMLNHSVILIGIAEKGFADVQLSYEAPGGHSSMPPSESVIGVLSKAVQRLETTLQPSMLGSGPETDFLQMIAPRMNILAQFFLKNIWFFKPVLSFALGSVGKAANAMIRTTTAVTKFHAGFKSNVLPHRATVTVNHRIHPSQTVDQVIKIDTAIINDPRVTIELGDHMEPSPIADHSEDSFGFQAVAASAQQVFPEGVVVVNTMIAKTDTTFFTNFTNNIYRFSPNHMHNRDLHRIHGADERIKVDVYEKAINFYYHLFLNSGHCAQDFFSKSRGHKPSHSSSDL